ncbi:MAG: putative tRNA threonylcarbamoyladenosine biosynthesis protein Gcp [Candidatus Woesebacteria bacterium GW2011_GWA1_37_8]|uniref:tRNA N6-adenosine threonylcarbamoyltransferase n=2 Tax=Candidatus Woeseibacteriota TaxID=1752722 RepID=A0A0G0HZP1_9BACT|nr:MAG: hypothetical protein US39_C0018G0004 [Microgenomates group bacterium GW2011_GWC1_37_12b]KKQ44095.1 MAG: putative tRNA threonylcarbamoyladenosine biosynthesis protein Gcp [Candidatus Woesebacteria bacterium GW2011_GWA1_37_8]
MKILAIDTSCDETAAAVTENETVVSNVIWSQASLHAKFGGVVPSLAQRQHEERIDWVINRALKNAKTQMINVDAIAVTVGPGLGIALGVGINKAKDLAKKYKLLIIPINHVESHLLSPLAQSKTNTNFSHNKYFPAYGLVVSGGNTLFVYIKGVGEYEVLAQTVDDALGEALDKAARMLGLGYPGGAVLEKFAKQGKANSYPLPIPMIGQEKRMEFSYSGLKTALWRLVEKEKQEGLNKEIIANLATSYQNVAFEHIIRVLNYYLSHNLLPNTNYLFLGGGVGANTLLRKKLRVLLKSYNLKLITPYSKRLYGDNAAMVGVSAYLKNKNTKVINYKIEEIDRKPDLNINQDI